MKVSWNCLQHIIKNIEISPTQLAEKLTLAGLETETIEYNKNIYDIIFDFNLTANRKDIKSTVDIAREISTLTYRPLKLQQNICRLHTLKDKSLTVHFSQIYISRIENININKNYPHIEQYLRVHDREPYYNILDILTFAEIQWGNRVKIYASNNNKNLFIKGSFTQIVYDEDKQSIKINNELLYTIDYINPTIEYKNIDIFLIYYLKINHVNDNNLAHSLILETYNNIFQQINQNTCLTQIYYYNHYLINKTFITCSYKKIRNILGPINHLYSTGVKYLSKQSIHTILKQLKLKVLHKKTYIKVQINNNRTHDLIEDIDIIEEIGRIYGFNKFKDILPRFKNKNGNTQKCKFHFLLKKQLRSMGFNEVLNYSLNKQTISNSIKLINPLNKEQQNLRTNLIDNLISNQKLNSQKKNHLVEMFEVGKIFIKQRRKPYYREITHIAGILQNEKFNQINWNNSYKPLHWLQAKGQLEELFKKTHSEIQWSSSRPDNYIEKNLETYLYSKYTCYIIHDDSVIGFLGQVKYDFAKKYNFSSSTYVFEINVNQLKQNSRFTPHLQYIYQFYSNYPSIEKDISFSINRKLQLNYINQIIYNLIKKHKSSIEYIQLLNIYTENNAAKKIHIRITYRSISRTFTHPEINILHRKLLEDLNLSLASNKR